MNDADKAQFLSALITMGALYDKDDADVRKKSPLYWQALNHRSLDEILDAMNKHARDADRGRFFPKPADIEAQMPESLEMWPSPNEAWAMAPKDDYASTAMCEEIAQALGIAQPLIDSGDTIAARMAFLEAYKRRVGDAKAQGKHPHWFKSLGEDSSSHYQADVKLVQMRNLSLSPSEQLALPEPQQVNQISLEYLGEKAKEHATDKEAAHKNLMGILGMLKGDGNE